MEDQILTLLPRIEKTFRCKASLYNGSTFILHRMGLGLALCAVRDVSATPVFTGLAEPPSRLSDLMIFSRVFATEKGEPLVPLVVGLFREGAFYADLRKTPPVLGVNPGGEVRIHVDPRSFKELLG